MVDLRAHAIRVADLRVDAAERRAVRFLSTLGDGPQLDADRLEEERAAYREELRLDGFTDDDEDDEPEARQKATNHEHR
jgi:hypothetical protein